MSGRPAPSGHETLQAAGRAGDLPGALELHCRRFAEEPALFYPDGLEVRWRSWRTVSEQVELGAAALREAGVEGGSPVALLWRCHPDAVAADLAVQAAGGVSVPVSDAAEAVAAGARTWLLQPDERPPDGGFALAALPPAGRPGDRARRPRTEPVAPPPGAGARVLGEGEAGGGPPGSRDLGAAAIVTSALTLGARLETAAGGADDATGLPRPGREIAVASFDLRTSAGRAFLAWSLLSGAALYLEPDPRALPGAAAWARPTLMAAGAAPLTELARQVRRRGERPLRAFRRRLRSRRPFGRLRLLLVLGDGRLPVADVPFWAERGVVVLRG